MNTDLEFVIQMFTDFGDRITSTTAKDLCDDLGIDFDLAMGQVRLNEERAA